MRIPFNRPYVIGREFDYLREAIANHHLSGDGPFTRRCNEWLEQRIGCKRALLVHSCTAGLEMAALLCDIGPGDEVIMPSYTFVSTANAFVLRGAIPVFVDIRGDTLNLDEKLVAAAITPKTKAICVVHYAGVGVEMEPILELARLHGLKVIEDAAQGIQSSWRGRPLGSIGHVAALSFHETKNVISGEGGALLINDPTLVERAEILWQKGTNRQQFLAGQVDKYTWVDVGSSFLPSEIIAAFLWAQLEEAETITARRLALWDRYHELLAPLAERHGLELPTVPAHCVHNAHLYRVMMRDADQRRSVLAELNRRDVNATFHYVPLHDSPAGRRFARTAAPLPVTEDQAARLIRLPLWVGMVDEPDRVVKTLESVLVAGR